jgi:S-adenosyl-L-methionine hydrolase (adenosine-forming)
MITLLTDFGVADYFVAAVKGVILSLAPEARIVDLTHEIPAQDVEAGAFTLGACYRDFPPGTIHLAVVDPGVGSARRAIVVAASGSFFVGPDNGIFSHVYAREAGVRVFHAAREEFFRRPVSATFHGRDVFAPLAAWLSRGLAPEALGAEITDYARLDMPRPTADPARETVAGAIIHVDRFGNCVTNLTPAELPPGTTGRLTVNDHEVTHLGTHFAEADRGGGLFAYLGSAGYWEIGLWCASAAKQLDARRGTRVCLSNLKLDISNTPCD